MTDIDNTHDAEKADLLKRVEKIEDALQKVILRLQTSKDFVSFRAATEYLWNGVMKKGEPE